jgi:hypothetical protein
MMVLLVCKKIKRQKIKIQIREVVMRKHLGAAFDVLDFRRKVKKPVEKSRSKGKESAYFVDEAQYAYAYALRVARIIDDDVAQLIVEAKDDGILTLNDATHALRQFSAADPGKPL